MKEGGIELVLGLGPVLALWGLFLCPGEHLVYFCNCWVNCTELESYVPLEDLESGSLGIPNDVIFPLKMRDFGECRNLGGLCNLGRLGQSRGLILMILYSLPLLFLFFLNFTKMKATCNLQLG